MDKVYLRGIELFAHGGVSEAEQEVGQHYRADVELGLDLSPASSSDSLDDTADLAEVYRIVLQTAHERPFFLVESLAGRIAESLLQALRVRRVTVRLEKLLPPMDGVVAAEGVEISRELGS